MSRGISNCPVSTGKLATLIYYSVPGGSSQSAIPQKRIGFVSPRQFSLRYRQMHKGFHKWDFHSCYFTDSIVIINSSFPKVSWAKYNLENRWENILNSEGGRNVWKLDYILSHLVNVRNITQLQNFLGHAAFLCFINPDELNYLSAAAYNTLQGHVHFTYCQGVHF